MANVIESGMGKSQMVILHGLLFDFEVYLTREGVVAKEDKTTFDALHEVAEMVEEAVERLPKLTIQES